MDETQPLDATTLATETPPPPPPPDAPEPDAIAEDAAPPLKMVPEQRLDRLTRQREDEKRRADAAESRLREIERENASYRAAIFQKMESEAQKHDPLPPLDDDPRNLAEHVRVTQQAIVEFARQNEQMAKEQAFRDRVAREVAQARAAHPDYETAYQHAFAMRVKMNAHLGPERAIQAAQAEERAFIIECHQHGINPAVAVIDVAKGLGYQAPLASIPETQVRARAQREASGLPKGGASASSAGDYSNLDDAQYMRKRAEFRAKHPGASTEEWRKYYIERGGKA